MSKSIDYGWSYKSWIRARQRVECYLPLPVRRTADISRTSPFVLGIFYVWGQFRFVHSRRNRHKAYAARCPLHLPRYIIRRDAGRRDKGRGGKPFVSSCFYRSGAAIDIPKCILIYVSYGSYTCNTIYEITCDLHVNEVL